MALLKNSFEDEEDSAQVLATDELHPAIPRVSCPKCGTSMRLAKILTDVVGTGFVYFDCECGFEYKMSDRVRTEA